MRFNQSSNTNEANTPILNFFNDKILHAQKAQNIKNVYKKHLSSNIKSLRQFSFLTNFV